MNQKFKLGDKVMKEYCEPHEPRYFTIEAIRFHGGNIQYSFGGLGKWWSQDDLILFREEPKLKKLYAYLYNGTNFEQEYVKFFCGTLSDYFMKEYSLLRASEYDIEYPIK